MSNKRITKREIYRKKNITHSGTKTLGEDSKYSMLLTSYRVGKPEDHYWDFTRAVIYKTGVGKSLFTIDRNYSVFYWEYIPNHPANGHDYLIVGRDYHGGYSILDLTTGVEQQYKPKKVGKYAAFFCWIQPIWNRENKTIAVEGCYWAAPYEVWTYDFSNPDIFPLPIVGREDMKEEPEEEEEE